MDFESCIARVRSELLAKHADAWIIVDYENKHPVTQAFFGDKMLTRKLFLVLPKDSRPYIVCHAIDQKRLEEDAGIVGNFDFLPYKTWEEMCLQLRRGIVKYRKALMDFVAGGALQLDSAVDYGTAAYVRSLGIVLSSSADLLQYFTATISEEGIASQRSVCEKLLTIKDEAFAKISAALKSNSPISEYDVQQFICQRFDEEGLFYDEAPIVAIGKNANDPHYAPSEAKSSPIELESLVLIDMWAKENRADAIYGDITWMGYTGKEVPVDCKKAFEALKTATDAGIEYLKKNLSGNGVRGYQLDDVVRQVINEKGYEDYFIHRTGHNIYNGPSPHGPGANVDNYETHDNRHLLEHTSFSIEPGIYTPVFGMRSETDVTIIDGNPEVVGGRQTEIIKLL